MRGEDTVGRRRTEDPAGHRTYRVVAEGGLPG